MRAVGLASLQRAMPDRDASRRMSAPGAITLLACQPEAMREDLVRVISRPVTPCLRASEEGVQETWGYSSGKALNGKRREAAQRAASIHIWRIFAR